MIPPWPSGFSSMGSLRFLMLSWAILAGVARAEEPVPAPRSAEESGREFRVPDGLHVELVASEPLVESPGAIDWGTDGKPWLSEMRDHPSGLDGRGKPGGRIVSLEDLDGDGRDDQATTFLDDLLFPTGVMAWRKGVLVCSAPDIRAHGAHGLIGDTIRGDRTGKEVILGGRDFRTKPDTGTFEPASGLTQQSRVRDDRGHQFGGGNGVWIQHDPLPDHHARRNLHVASPNAGFYVPRDLGSRRLYPISRIIAGPTKPKNIGQVTSAWSPLILRAALEELRNTGQSLMPEGLERDLAPTQPADLLASLNASNRPKTMAGNHPETVAPDPSGFIRLQAETASIHGDTLIFETPFANLGHWQSANDQASWTFRADRASTFALALNNACADDSSGSVRQVRVGTQTSVGEIAGTDKWSDYRPIIVRELTLPAGTRRLDIRPATPIRGALMDLRELTLTPG